MHGDYVYPSIFLSYLLFFLFLAGGIFFFIRSFRDGYWGKHGEDIKYTVLDDEEGQTTRNLELNRGDDHARS